MIPPEPKASLIEPPNERGPGAALWATGGLLGAMLASSCCILPLALVALGVSGAWVGSLSALERYSPLFVAAALACLAAGFRHVYLRPVPACADGSACGRTAVPRLAKAALWAGTVLVTLAITQRWWAPWFY